MPSVRGLKRGLMAGAVVSLVVAPAAHAGIVTFKAQSPGSYIFNTDYKSTTGEGANNLTVVQGPNWTTTDWYDANYATVASTGCTAIAGGHVECPRSNTTSVKLLGDNDRARVQLPSGAVTVLGGAGNDDLYGTTFGSAAQVFGESGDDDIGAGGDGGATADGGSGNDTVFCCGGQDGGTAIGGTGNDLIRARSGQPGTVNSDGGTGNDTILGSAGTSPSTAVGGDGNDVIAIHGSSGGFRPKAHTVTGGAGDDVLFGGPIEGDAIDGGDGRDVIDVAGGGADTVNCGSGTDVVRFDETDTIAADCEIKLAGDGTF